jgi:tRNA(Ile)-lysidine synthase
MKRHISNITIWNKLTLFCKRNKLFSPGDRVLVGLSGGADSVFLLHFLSKLSNKLKFQIICAHLNHCLRGKDADRDENFCKSICKSFRIDLFTKKIDVKSLAKTKKLSLEHAARKVRYSFFEQTCKKHNCNKIALAHHLDDHVETVFLNLLRGTEPKGLIGITLKRNLKENSKLKIEVVRPLLSVSKKEILSYIKTNKINFRTDKSNLSDEFTRNWLRKNVIPLLERKQPQLNHHMWEMSQKLAKVLKK